MSPETRAILERHYGYAKGALKKMGAPTAAERAFAKREGYALGAMVTLGHDESVRRVRAAAAKLRPDEVTRGFVAGVGGSALRGRQLLVAYAYARHLPVHRATLEAGYDTCRTCGIDTKARVDVTEQALRVHLGFVWNEGHSEFFADLEEIVRSGVPTPTRTDRDVLRALLAVAARAEPDCTPGQLEKALAAKKIVPSSDKYARYGILEALAMVGVLPNALLPPEWDRFVTCTEIWQASSQVKSGPRSDVVLPFGAWRGALGVDWRRAKALFGIARA